MGVNKNEVLRLLPPYNNEWRLIQETQDVPDIINEIFAAHRVFERYYDRFSYLFRSNSVDALCNKLYTFCVQNIAYREESIKQQTTALPTGILMRGKGDCKHYALIIAGIVDSLNRCWGYNIPWRYYFASYDKSIKEPYHVFVCVMDGDTEVWIDPTPGTEGKQPTLLVTGYM